MSDATFSARLAPRRAAAAASGRFDWTTVLIGFLVLAAVLIIKALVSAGTTPLFADTDDAMRMVTVRDLLAGQNWFDHLQHRLNTPFGAELHWSHLPDAAIGGLVLLFRPLAGAFSETIAAYCWPLLLLLGLLVLSARLAFRLGGREAILAAVVLPLVSPALIPEFSPGRLDHDSLQILLTLLMAWGAIGSIRQPRFAIMAGLAAALSLTIGIEGLPGVVSAVLAIALIWVVRPERADGLRLFSLSLALATVLLFAEAYPPARWLEPACDEISIVYVAFATGTGAVLTLLSLLPRGLRWGQRLAIGGAGGAALAVALVLAFPLCLKGPYAALDPWLVANWLNNIAEAKPIWDSFRAVPAITVGNALLPVLGLAVIAIRVWREPAQRGEWLILGLFLAIAVAVMCAEIRGARLAAPLALPAAGWLIARARARYLSSKSLAGALGLLASWLGSSGLVVLVILTLAAKPFAGTAEGAALAPPGSSALACEMPGAFKTLAALPPARVMTLVDLGSHLLLYTPHAVVAAPYHRDQAGVLDAFHFFDGPIGAARQILAARGVSLVVICPAMPEMAGLSDTAPDAFVRLFAENRLPGWLQPVGAQNGALRVYRVLPQ